MRTTLRLPRGIHSNGDGDRAAALEGELAVFSLGQTRRWAEASGHGGGTWMEKCGAERVRAT